MIPSASTQPLSPLRQSMLEDMRMRKLEPRTQEAYIRAVRKLTAYPISSARPMLPRWKTCAISSSIWWTRAHRP